MNHSFTYPLNHPTLKLEQFRLQQQKALRAAEVARFTEMAVTRAQVRLSGTGRR